MRCASARSRWSWRHSTPASVYAIHVAESQIPDAIVDITSATGGDIFQPGDEAGLRSVFERIDAMQETRIEKVRAEPIDDYGPLGWTGLAVLGAALLASFGLRYTPW